MRTRHGTNPRYAQLTSLITRTPLHPLLFEMTVKNDVRDDTSSRKILAGEGEYLFNSTREHVPCLILETKAKHTSA